MLGQGWDGRSEGTGASPAVCGDRGVGGCAPEGRTGRRAPSTALGKDLEGRTRAQVWIESPRGPGVLGRLHLLSCEAAPFPLQGGLAQPEGQVGLRPR